MKILYFTQLFYPALFGGGEYIFYQWAQEMAKRGHQVFVVTQKLQGTKHHETLDGIEIFRVGSELKFGGTLPIGIFANLSFLLGSYFKGKQIIKKHDIDLIHSNTYVPVISAQWCAAKFRIPHIATVHDIYYTSKKDFWKTWSQQPNTSRATSFLGPCVEKSIAKKKVTLFHTVSEKSKSDLQELGVDRKIVVIPNGIDPAKYQVENVTTKNQVIFVGRLVFYKNLDVLLDAFAQITKKIPDARLVIVGEGPVKNDLVKKSTSLRIKDDVTFTGNISDQQKMRLISESRVLVNPSLVEGFGIVVLEGFACGKPVIVSDSKPLSDLVDDGKDGFVVSATDSQKWSQKIIELLLDPQKAEEMGKRGKEKVASNYSISKISDDMVKLYQSVIISSKTS